MLYSTALPTNLSTTGSSLVSTSVATLECEQAQIIRKTELAIALAMANGIIQVIADSCHFCTSTVAAALHLNLKIERNNH